MKRQSRWVGLLVKPATVAILIGFFSFFGLSDRIAGFSANLGEKDRIVRWSAVLSGATRDAIPVTLIDIDAATMAALGHPVRAPRDLLAGLLALAAAKRPSGIFLDMDTSQPTEPAKDQALADFIAAYPPASPTLALARRLAPADEAGSGAARLVETPSILDVVVKERDNVLWATSVSRIDEDRVVRRWELSQTLCTPDGGRTLPSPQLIAAAVAGAPARPLSDVRAFTDRRTRALCGNGAMPDGAGEATSWPSNPDPRAAIAFLIPDGPDLATVPFIRREGRSVPLFRRVSARALMSANGSVVSPAAVADELLRDRFVVIGASHAESMDRHLTPIGFIPGALIVVNAIATAPAVLSGYPLGPIGATLIALALFGGLWSITSRLRALAAGVVVVVAVIGALLALGWFLAPTTAGDIVLAAFGMLAFFSTIEGLYTIAREWRVRGWRALLKPAKPREAQHTEDVA